ncbi:TetR/AcrR family transcriptional regulator [Acidothermaceae bacterium B102]|nr:TetR/AcrR family transcriptional regulator [Acidothermaceae bacterium B102]
MANDSRSRMVASAAALIGSRGVSATSFSDVLAESGAPRGSIYHHFPDGKTQLAQDAVRWTSGRVLAHQAAYEGTTARGVLERFVAMWRNVVLSSDGSAGCVVAGVAIDTTARDVALVDVVRETFRAWVDLLTSQLEATGIGPPRARAIATATLAGMEGALILCRAEGGVGPLDTVSEGLYALLAADPVPPAPQTKEPKPKSAKKKHKKSPAP